MQEQIKNIIFDLGDVIINIDVPLAARSFAELCGQEEAEVIELFKEKDLFRQFETGELDEAAFRSYVRQILKKEDWDDVTINKAWNTLLLDIPPARIELLRKLRERYKLYLLSNTSPIHIAEVNNILDKVSGVPRLDELFDKLFLSYEMGVMKPDPAIYLKVLEEAGIKAEETLFLDDNAANIQAASALGIHTIHVQKPTTILEYLKDYVA